MAKHVLSKARLFAPAALVVVGWFLYLGGLLTQNTIVKIVLLSAARVLPQALRYPIESLVSVPRRRTVIAVAR